MKGLGKPTVYIVNCLGKVGKVESCMEESKHNDLHVRQPKSHTEKGTGVSAMAANVKFLLSSSERINSISTKLIRAPFNST